MPLSGLDCDGFLNSHQHTGTDEYLTVDFADTPFAEAEKERDAQLKSPRLEAVCVQQHDAQGDHGPFGKSKSFDDVLKKLEARSGPEARALFERFLKEAAKLERSGNGQMTKHIDASGAWRRRAPLR
jgi:hypothetical protein